MHEEIEVGNENGVLRPLTLPLGAFHESERYTVTVETPDHAARSETACLAAAHEAVPAVSLEEVRQIFAKVPGTTADALALERAER